jgi:hypothetical protein
VGKTELVDRYKDDAEELVKRLDAEGIPPLAAFWLRVEDAHEWRFVVAPALVDQSGPLETYAWIQRALLGMGRFKDSPDTHVSLLSLELEDISALSPADQMVLGLARQYDTGEGLQRIEVSDATVGGVWIQRAILYRVNATAIKKQALAARLLYADPQPVNARGAA